MGAVRRPFFQGKFDAFVTQPPVRCLRVSGRPVHDRYAADRSFEHFRSLHSGARIAGRRRSRGLLHGRRRFSGDGFDAAPRRAHPRDADHEPPVAGRLPRARHLLPRCRAGHCGALAWSSIGLVGQSYAFNDISTGLDATPLWIPQLGMAIGTTVFALAFAVDLVDLLTGRKVREEPKDGEPAHIE